VTTQELNVVWKIAFYPVGIDGRELVMADSRRRLKYSPTVTLKSTQQSRFLRVFNSKKS